MNISTLIKKELFFRPVSSGIQLIIITLAVTAIIYTHAAVIEYRISSDLQLEAKKADTDKRMKAMEDEYRKITKRMGFNILIIPKKQDLGDYYTDDVATQYMPESYVKTLAHSKIVTIQHLLPTLKHKIQWPEQKRKILMIGVRDEVPIAHRDPKKPILHPVPPGTVALGHELHHSLDIKAGDTLTFMGKSFVVHKNHKERGNKDDVSMWFDLSDAQALLNKPDLINGIMALECKCAFANLAKVRAEIAGILPDTQVLEFSSIALARAEARQEAGRVAKQSIENEALFHQQTLHEKQQFAQVLNLILIVVCGSLIAFLSTYNIRERMSEIGLLRAIGLSSNQILKLFLAKSLLLGISAGALGILLGLIYTSLQSEHPLTAFYSPTSLVLILLITPLLCCVAAWLPCIYGISKDPANILRMD